MSLVRNINLHDGFGNPIGSFNGALDIHDADVHNIIINKYTRQYTAVNTTLSVATVGDGTEYTISVADATGFTVGNHLHIDTTSVETTMPVLLSTTAATGPAVFTIDRRIDLAHNIGDTVTSAVIDMSSLIGTLATPQKYIVGPEAGEVWHITRLLFEITHTSAGDLGFFGNQTALTNGVVLRAKISNQYGTFTNWKTNADIKADMYDVEFDARSGGGGTWGTTGRGSFNRAGAVIRLDGSAGDSIEVDIQDDLTGLSTFTMKFQGHVEGA